MIQTQQELDVQLAFRKLNDEGQRVAIERVGELAQIPKYQRQQDTPAGQGDEEPEAKK